MKRWEFISPTVKTREIEIYSTKLKRLSSINKLPKNRYWTKPIPKPPESNDTIINFYRQNGTTTYSFFEFDFYTDKYSSEQQHVIDLFEQIEVDINDEGAELFTEAGFDSNYGGYHYAYAYTKGDFDNNNTSPVNSYIKFPNAINDNSSEDEYYSLVILNDLGIIGNIDLSPLKVANYLEIWKFNELTTGIILPQSFSNVGVNNEISVSSCDGIEVLDFSNTTSPTPLDLRLSDLPIFNNLILNENNIDYSDLYIVDTPLLSLNDLRGIKLDGIIEIENTNSTELLLPEPIVEGEAIYRIRRNNNLTKVILPTVSHNQYHSMTGSFAVSISIYENPNLGDNGHLMNFSGVPNLINMDGGDNTAYSLIRLTNNNFTAASVNSILHEIDSVAVSGYNYRRISIGGTTYPNAAPDSTSGGVDGLAAKLSLESKGFIVNVNVSVS